MSLKNSGNKIINLENNDLSIIVVGYDGYCDVWDNFVYFINKYWPDRPKTYLATSELEPKYERIEVIKAGKDSEWSKKARTALEKINTKYVLMLLEDFFITDFVDNNEINKILTFIKNNNVLFYQLTNQYFSKYTVPGKKIINKNYLHIITNQHKHGLNLQAAIWDREYLLKIIGKENYNGWEFEIKNLYLTNFNENNIQHFNDDRNVLNIAHAVLQSKYFPSVFYKSKSLGHVLNIKNRGVLSIKEEIKFKIKTLMRDITPRSLEKPFKLLARHLGFNFVSDKYSISNKNNVNKENK